jgi:hypothetical protein
VVLPLGLSEDSVQDGSADSSAPPLGNDEEVAEEAPAGYRGTRPVLATQRRDGCHPDQRRPFVGQQEPGGGVAQVGLDMLDPGRSVGPHTPTAGQIRPLVDGNRGIDIGRVTQPDQNRHAEKLQLRLEPTHYRVAGREANCQLGASIPLSVAGRAGGARRPTA